MWRRKTEAEIKAMNAPGGWSDSRFNPTKPAIIAIVITALLTFSTWTGSFNGRYGSGRYARPPVPFNEAIKLAPRIFIIFFPLAYVACMAVGGLKGGFPRKSNKPPVVICNRCYQAQAETADDNCPCGGKFELFELWTWDKDSVTNS